MMALYLRLTTENSHDLRELISLSEETWETLAARLQQVDRLPIRRSELQKIVADAISPEALEAVVRQLLGLGKLMREQQTNAAEVTRSVQDALEREDWPEDDLALWNKRRQSLDACLETNAVQAVVKALDLAIEHERLLASANIITDIRPIFDDAKSEIIGGIIANMLRLRYFEEREERSITLLLSKKDITKLKNVCEHALQKSEASSALMSETCNVRTYSIEEEDNDES